MVNPYELLKNIIDVFLKNSYNDYSILIKQTIVQLGKKLKGKFCILNINFKKNQIKNSFLKKVGGDKMQNLLELI